MPAAWSFCDTCLTLTSTVRSKGYIKVLYAKVTVERFFALTHMWTVCAATAVLRLRPAHSVDSKQQRKRSCFVVWLPI